MSRPKTVRKVAPIRPPRRASDPLALIVRGIESASKVAPHVANVFTPSADQARELERVKSILLTIEDRLGIRFEGEPPSPSERLAYLAGLLRGLLPQKKS